VRFVAYHKPNFSMKVRLRRFLPRDTRARYCYGKSYVRLSVRDVDVSWSHRLEFFENNFTVS